jgi:hypothetical protein
MSSTIPSVDSFRSRFSIRWTLKNHADCLPAKITRLHNLCLADGSRSPMQLCPPVSADAYATIWGAMRFSYADCESEKFRSHLWKRGSCIWKGTTQRSPTTGLA